MPEATKVEIKSPPAGSEAPKPPPSELTIENAPAPVTPAKGTPAPAETPKPKYVISDEDIQAASQEFAKSGSLSDATIQGFETKGVPASLVVQFVQGAEAIHQLAVQAVYNEAGGKDNFETMRSWAKAGLTEAEQAAFDKVAKTGTQKELIEAVRGLKAKYEEKNGSPPAALSGGRRGPSGPTPYSSHFQAVADMQKLEYHNDPAFRKEVEQRLAVSNF